MLLSDTADAVVHIDDDDEEWADKGDENYRKLSGRPEQNRKRHPCQRRNRPQQLDHGVHDLLKYLPGTEQQSQRNPEQLRHQESVANSLEAHDPRLPVTRIRQILVPEGPQHFTQRRYAFEPPYSESNQYLPQQDECSHRNRPAPV